jgi:hypothetical protein
MNPDDCPRLLFKNRNSLKAEKLDEVVKEKGGRFISQSFLLEI